MNWYLAKMVYQVISGKGNHTPQFDEQLRLIRADELDWAWEKARVLGNMEESSFLNDNKETVQWKFVDVADVYEIKDIEDGVQLYSRTEEPENAEAYVGLVHAKARHFRKEKALTRELIS